MYLAYDMGTEQADSVAIKISKSNYTDVANSRKEGRFLNQLKNKIESDGIDIANTGVVKMIDEFLFRGHYIIVFELLGQTLYKYL